VGLAAADVSHTRGAGGAPLLLGAVLAAMGACLAWRKPVWRNLALVACAVSLGAGRGMLVSDAAPHNPLQPFVGGHVRLRALANAPPTFTTTSAHLAIEIEAVGPSGLDPPPPGSAGRASAPALVIGDPAVLRGVAVGAVL